MLRKIRMAVAIFFWTLLTLLFLDFTGTLHTWFGWMAKIQFLPAVLGLNLLVVLFLILLTLVFGRIYCSVICPLGVMQDIIAWFGRRGRKKKYRYSYSPEKRVLRLVVLALFIVALVAGIGSFVALLAPYSSYGRIASNLLAPVYAAGNNLLAFFAERMHSYAFYETSVWIKSLPTLLIAIVTLVCIGILAWRNGRTYCNTTCPVGTVLGYLSRFSLFRIRINPEACNQCGLCSRRCKAACINGKAHTVDYSRCVACMDCIDTCRHGAISFGLRTTRKADTRPRPSAPTQNSTSQPSDKDKEAGVSRRSFLSAATIFTVSAAARAQEKKVDGGLAVIEDKQIPQRQTAIVPPGAVSIRHFAQHCTGCQLCVSVCPNEVLRPSTKLSTLMQPEMSYERGYCRPECNKCSEVCPTGAIRLLSVADKSATQIGHAVWVRKNCVPLTDGVECGNCARHCPTGAIQMVPSDPQQTDSPKIPVVNTERCIGCGACENLCPARPFSAIYVEGYSVHREI